MFEDASIDVIEPLGEILNRAVAMKQEAADFEEESFCLFSCLIVLHFLPYPTGS